MKSFEDMQAWQLARNLVGQVFILEKLTSSPAFGIWYSQMCRATLSIMNNLAEGFERGSAADMKRFYQMAKGSAAEVRSMLAVGKDVEFLGAETAETLARQVIEIRALIIGLMRSIPRTAQFEVREETSYYRR